MAAVVRSERKRTQQAQEPQPPIPVGSEPTLWVDRLGLWIWLGGAALLILAHVLGHLIPVTR